MPFIRTNPYADHEGHLLCDWIGCGATSPTFRMGFGPFPFEGWAVVPRKTAPREPTAIEYFCEDHTPRHAVEAGDGCAS